MDESKQQELFATINSATDLEGLKKALLRLFFQKGGAVSMEKADAGRESPQKKATKDKKPAGDKGKAPAPKKRKPSESPSTKNQDSDDEEQWTSEEEGPDDKKDQAMEVEQSQVDGAISKKAFTVQINNRKAIKARTKAAAPASVKAAESTKTGTGGPTRTGAGAGPTKNGAGAGPHKAGAVAGGGPHKARAGAGPHKAGASPGPHKAGEGAGPHKAGPSAGPHKAGEAAGPHKAGPGGPTEAEAAGPSKAAALPLTRTVTNKAAGPRNPRVKPLVLEGLRALSEEIRAHPLTIKRALKEGCTMVAKTVTTKNGNTLVFPKTEEDSAKLLQLTLAEGFSLRPTKASTAANKRITPSVVILGVHPAVGDEDMSAELERSCRRIMSSRLNGQPTWKVKMDCQSEEDRAAVLKNGVVVGLQHYKATAYIMKKPVLQCYKCQGFQHVAAACTSEEKCRRCGQQHHSKDCTAEQPVCANCGGAHTASDFACPQFLKETVTRETKTLSYANAVSKGGNQVDSIRLACTIATSISSVIRRANIQVKASDICKDVADNVAHFYKANIKGEHVYNIAFNKNVKTSSQ